MGTRSGIGRSLAAVVVFSIAIDATAIVLEDPANFAVKRTWSALADLGIPTPLGGLLFSVDGATL